MYWRFMTYLMAFALTAVFAVTVQAQRYIASLDGIQVVPANNSTGRGICQAAFTNYIVFSLSCEYTGLSSGLTGAHLHFARVGQNGGTTIDLSPQTGGTSGTISMGGVLPPIIDELQEKRVYVDLHTANYPNGEIRGQIKIVALDADADGDGMTDISVFRPADGNWHLMKSCGNIYQAGKFGTADDRLAPADYTGDGKTDIAVFRPASGDWYVLRSDDATFYGFHFGATGDLPAPADYNADTKAEPAVYRAGVWYILRTSPVLHVVTERFGAPGDQPVPADYDGDGSADLAVYRPSLPGSQAEWYIRQTLAGEYGAYFGTVGDRAVPADYTGDGRTDIAVWRPSTGVWYVLKSEDHSLLAYQFGAEGDQPAPGDYDADGKVDAAVYRSGTWYISGSLAGIKAYQFGIAGDVAVPGAYVK